MRKNWCIRNLLLLHDHYKQRSKVIKEFELSNTIRTPWTYSKEILLKGRFLVFINSDFNKLSFSLPLDVDIICIFFLGFSLIEDISILGLFAIFQNRMPQETMKIKFYRKLMTYSVSVIFNITPTHTHTLIYIYIERERERDRERDE